MPDYAYKVAEGEEAGGTSVAGIVGGFLTFALAGVTGLVIARIKKKAKVETA